MFLSDGEPSIRTLYEVILVEGSAGDSFSLRTMDRTGPKFVGKNDCVSLCDGRLKFEFKLKGDMHKRERGRQLTRNYIRNNVKDFGDDDVISVVRMVTGALIEVANPAALLPNRASSLVRTTPDISDCRLMLGHLNARL